MMYRFFLLVIANNLVQAGHIFLVLLRIIGHIGELTDSLLRILLQVREPDGVINDFGLHKKK